MKSNLGGAQILLDIDQCGHIEGQEGPGVDQTSHLRSSIPLQRALNLVGYATSSWYCTSNTSSRSLSSESLSFVFRAQPPLPPQIPTAQCCATVLTDCLSGQWVDMKPISPSPHPPDEEVLKAIPYSETAPAKPPIPITVAKPASSSSHKGTTRLRRSNSFKRKIAPQILRSKLHDDVRRDSGLAASSSTTRDSRTTLGTEVDSASSIRHSQSLPNFSAHQVGPASPTSKSAIEETPKTLEDQSDNSTRMPVPSMSILTEIPTGSFEDLTLPGQVEFSKRGSMLIGGKKANKATGEALGNGKVIGSRRQQDRSLIIPSIVVPKRVLSADDLALSQKVRSLYKDTDHEGHRTTEMDRNGTQSGSNGQNHDTSLRVPPYSQSTPGAIRIGIPMDSALPHKSDAGDRAHLPSLREVNELAGGIEDWENLDGGDVDRYGFIVPRQRESQASSLSSRRPASPDRPQIKRMSTMLRIASDAPRKVSSHRRLSKSPARSTESPSPSSLRPASRIVRPTSSQSSYRTIDGREFRMRSAANRLPYNKNRRYVDEAGDMLTLPPGLADIAEDEEGSKGVDEARKRERVREIKWQKMAKVVKSDKRGGGMVFEFDTKNPKLIERTWKGIPDRWRATAWHAFLTASAKKRQGNASDAELIAGFHTLIDESSPDDVQIDIDVPRTINSHIMFRRRYRGGQRLLFRVLHCLSIYFPDVGYVQGMAALAATLLCYFDEEMTFVMLVRLWQLRGLERLYQQGFEGLTQALEEFEKGWLVNGGVAAKLVSSIQIIKMCIWTIPR